MNTPAHVENRRWCISPTNIGDLRLVAENIDGTDHLIGLYFPVHHPEPDMSAFGEQVDVTLDSFLSLATAQITEYLAAQRKTFDVPVHSVGTDFEQQVWSHIKKIPYGQTSSYGTIAKALGKPGAARGVGRAVGRNPISIIVPCHRVVGAHGAITGYAGGIACKKTLLDLEKPVDL